MIEIMALMVGAMSTESKKQSQSDAVLKKLLRTYSEPKKRQGCHIKV